MKLTVLVVAGLLLMSCLVLVWAQGGFPAQRPRRVTDANGAGVISVKARDDLQAALNAARPGDTIELEAGARFVGSFVLPVKRGEGWVTVRTSAHASLPGEDRRVSPEHAALMPKILSPGSGKPALRTEPGAHHFRFIGIEFAPAETAAQLYDLVAFGDTGKNQDTLDEMPHHLVLDRCYVHALAGQSLKRGVMLNSAHTEILNSHISDFKVQGQDSQAIAGWNGPGPFRIVNNYLEGAGENLLFGGADPSVPNLVPSDIEIRRNHFFKPVAWRSEAWTVKNLLELKNARRVVIDGNLFEHNWGQSQTGEAILFTVRNQDGTAPWSTVEDVEFVNNVVRDVGGGIYVLGQDNYHPSQQAKRLVIRNNLFMGVDGERWKGRGQFLMMTDKAGDVSVDHNTVLHTGMAVLADSGPHGALIFTNNLMAHNEYGVFGSGVGYGAAMLPIYFPRAVFRRNVVAGASPEKYPRDNFYPPVLSSARFVDANGGNYRLRADSPYRGQGTDGKDPGCDFDALNAALGEMALKTSRPGK